MATKDERLVRGRRRGQVLIARTIHELRDARIGASISQDTIARQLGVSQPTYWRLEVRPSDHVSVVRLAEMAALLGFELGMTLYPAGDPIRDKGQQALAKRFETVLSPRWHGTSETLLPLPGDLRSWDKLLRLSGAVPRHLVGVDLKPESVTSRPSFAARGSVSAMVAWTRS